MPLLDRLVGSPCCLPKITQSKLFPAYQKLGFKNFESFSSWAACRHEWTEVPQTVRAVAAAHGLSITSYHLPPITDDVEASLANAITAARFAAQLGDEVAVLFKANNRELFGQVGKRFLNALEGESITVTPVLQNHKGSAITTLADYREVLDRIDDDRMQCILEVGHFQRVGVNWSEGWQLLDGRIALFHINDINAAGESVRMGDGEVDFAGLLKRIKDTQHPGRIVVELELANRMEESAETLDGLGHAITHLSKLYDEA